MVTYAKLGDPLAYKRSTFRIPQRTPRDTSTWLAPRCAAYARVQGKRLFSIFPYATYKHKLDGETRTCSTRS